MAKKVVATLQTGKKDGRSYSKVIKMVKTKKVTAVNGEEIDIDADSICVHGDNPKAIEFVNRIRNSLIAEGISVVSLDKFIK